MKLCKCDNCGIIFNPKDRGTSNVKLEIYDSTHPLWPDGRTYDFCRKCTRGIEKFLNLKDKR